MIIPFDDRDGEIWFNGIFIPWRTAKIHVLSQGLHYASCIFEGERVYDGRIFALSEHSQRFLESSRYLDFELPYTVEQLNKATLDTVSRNGVENGYVRPVAWRGSERMGISGTEAKIHVAIAVWEWGNYFSAESLLSGISLQTSIWRRPAPNTAPVHAKAAGLYMICTLSRHQAETNGFTDALMLDYREQIAEATGANIFFVKDGKLHTPIADCFLNGITRQTVIKLAKKRNIDVIERAIWPQELSDIQEVFLTGTAAEITPVNRIDTHSFQVGQITQILLKDYKELVHKDESNRI